MTAHHCTAHTRQTRQLSPQRTPTTRPQHAHNRVKTHYILPLLPLLPQPFPPPLFFSPRVAPASPVDTRTADSVDWRASKIQTVRSKLPDASTAGSSGCHSTHCENRKGEGGEGTEGGQRGERGGRGEEEKKRRREKTDTVCKNTRTHMNNASATTHATNTCYSTCSSIPLQHTRQTHNTQHTHDIPQ